MQEKPLSQKYESKLLTCELLGGSIEEPSVVFAYGIPSNADLICPFLKNVCGCLQSAHAGSSDPVESAKDDVSRLPRSDDGAA